MEVSRVAFSSCYKPSYVPESSNFWEQVRRGSPDLWLWLGGNAHRDGASMTYKRNKYNEAREELHYVADGPVAEGRKIPIMATWDDHDYASNNQGNDYNCIKDSQAEFAIHFNLAYTLGSPWWTAGRCLQFENFCEAWN